MRQMKILLATAVFTGFLLGLAVENQQERDIVKPKPPIDDRLIDFKFPGVSEKILDNGLTLLVIEHHEVPKVYYRMGIDFGQKNDPDGMEGAVELMARVLKKGTQSRTYEELAEEIDFLGGELDASSTRDFFYVHGEFLKEYADRGLDLMSDVVMNPVFDPREVEKERSKMLADIENEKSSPSFLANRRLNKVLYSPHPYSKAKSPESIRNITREALLDLHRSNFVPSKTVLVVAGDITVEEALRKVRKYFGAWRSEVFKTQKFPLPEARTRRVVYLVDRPGSEQSNIVMGNLLFSRKSPEYEKVLVMNKILGGGASGRLFLYLREEKGYTYGAYSSLHTYKDTGGWVASAEVRTSVTDSALDAFFEQFDRIKAEAVPDEDLKNAKRYLIGVFPLQNETPASIAMLALQQKLYDLPENYWENYLKEIDAVTAEDVQTMARKYVDQDVMAVVVVGDVKKIKGRLTRFGPIEVYDVEDRRVD